MNICSFGRGFPDRTISYIDLESNQSLLDFDIAIFDLVMLAGSQGKHNHLGRRRAEVIDFLRLGRTVIAFIGHFQLELLFPIKGVATVESVGSRMDFRGPEQLKEFWSAIRGTVSYQAYLDGVCGKPFVFVAETDRAVAAWVQFERGNLILLPSLPPKFDFHSSGYQSACAGFLDNLRKLDQRLRPKKPKFELPSWSTHYTWPREADLRSSLVSLQEQAEKLLTAIASASSDLQKEEKLKLLLATKGDDLVDIVMDSLRELDLKVVKGEPGRDDLIIEFDGKHAVSEVKGKKGSAAEADAACFP